MGGLHSLALDELLKIFSVEIIETRSTASLLPSIGQPSHQTFETI